VAGRIRRPVGGKLPPVKTGGQDGVTVEGLTQSELAVGGVGGMNHASASTTSTAGRSMKSHVNIRRISVYIVHIHGAPLDRNYYS